MGWLRRRVTRDERMIAVENAAAEAATADGAGAKIAPAHDLPRLPQAADQANAAAPRTRWLFWARRLASRILCPVFLYGRGGA